MHIDPLIVETHTYTLCITLFLSLPLVAEIGLVCVTLVVQY